MPGCEHKHSASDKSFIAANGGKPATGRLAEVSTQTTVQADAHSIMHAAAQLERIETASCHI